jgi:hypothetical protein
MNRSVIDMTGRRVGRLLVLHLTEKRKGKQAIWLCRCDCGSIIEILGSSLRRSAPTKSCGCLHTERFSNLKHGLRHTPEYNAACCAKRRIRQSKTGVTWTAKAWMTLKKGYGNRCVGCWKTESELKALGRKLVPDHITPLSKGGLNHITNLQPLCHGRGGCNNSKGAKYIDFVIA